MIGRNLFNIYGTNNSFKSFLDTLLLPVKTGMKLCALVWMCHHCILDVCADALTILLHYCSPWLLYVKPVEHLSTRRLLISRFGPANFVP